jgi:hypothetical protein
MMDMDLQRAAALWELDFPDERLKGVIEGTTQINV